MHDTPHNTPPHPTGTVHPFADLRWYRVRATLKNTRTGPHKKSHPLVIVDAIQKSVTGIVASGLKARPHTLFHFDDTPEAQRTEGVWPVTFLFVGCERVYAEFWRETLRLYLTDETAQRNFALVALHEVEERTYAQVEVEQGAISREGELCLTLRTPLPCTPGKGKPRTHLSRDAFIAMYEKRFARLFGTDVRFTGARDFSLLTHFAHYTEIRHRSHSQRGATQYINGVCGPLYLKDAFADFLPYIILGSELHTGPKTAHAQGCYTLQKEPRPYFAPTFPDERLLAEIIREVLDTFDDVAQEQALAGGVEASADLARTLALALQDGSYTFTPHHAFTLRTGTKERRIEVPAFHDRVVLRHLARTLTPRFDALFEDSSVGYRKGLSRTQAIERVRAAFREGYRYVIRSDIDDFFPSVDHATLAGLVARYLPEADTRIRELIQRAYTNGYIENGAHVPRSKGLSQGSPLSPLLANLYLDSFDEGVQKEGVSLIRYADDFLIFTKSKEEAGELFSRVQALLSDIGLRVKEAKTAIVPIEEEFSFLGVRFAGREVEGDPGEAFDRALKQPLYVVEEGTRLMVTGPYALIAREGVIVECVRLRALRCVQVQANAVTLTKNFVVACARAGVPIHLTNHAREHGSYQVCGVYEKSDECEVKDTNSTPLA